MRSFVPKITILVALLAAVLLGACGASKHQVAIRDTVAVLDAAQGGLNSYDQTAINKITDAAKSKPDGLAALDTYDRKYAVAQKAIDAGYRAVGIAAALDSDVSLATMQTAAAAAIAAVAAVTGGLK